MTTNVKLSKEETHKDTGIIVALTIFLCLFFLRYVAFLAMLVWGFIQNAF